MAIEMRARMGPAAAAPAASGLPSAAGRRSRALRGSDRMFLTERLSLLLETGVPLHVALESLERQAPSDALRRVITRLLEDVSSGQSFSHALAQQPQSFSRTYVYLVDAAERGGFLPAVLLKLKEMDAKRQELVAVLLAAVTYPAFLLLFSAAVVVFVLVVVFPKFASLFVSIYDQLPITTRFLMTTSSLLLERWPWILGTLALLGLGIWRWSLRPDAAEKLDRWALGVPFLRDIVIELQLVQFLGLIGLALDNGVSLLEALQASREVSGSRSFRRFIADLEETVAQGGRVATGFENSRLVPSLVRQMIATGEESGRLAFVAGRVSSFYEQQWRRKLALLSKLAEPAMLVVMGAVVGILVTSLILPIFKLSTAVH